MALQSTEFVSLSVLKISQSPTTGKCCVYWSFTIGYYLPVCLPRPPVTALELLRSLNTWRRPKNMIVSWLFGKESLPSHQWDVCRGICIGLLLRAWHNDWMNVLHAISWIYIGRKEKKSSFPVSWPTHGQNPRPKKFSGIFKAKYTFGQFY